MHQHQMKTEVKHFRKRTSQAGQALTEYVITLSAFVGLFLFVTSATEFRGAITSALAATDSQQRRCFFSLTPKNLSHPAEYNPNHGCSVLDDAREEERSVLRNEGN